MKWNFPGSRTIASLLSLVLFLGIGGVTDLPLVAEAGDCAPIRQALKKTGKRIRKAKRITNRARKQKTVRRLKKKKRKLRRQLAACLAMPASSPVPTAIPETPIFPIAMVPVANPGNADDTADGDNLEIGDQPFGGVSEAFQIGKYEVTLEQYAAFLNAVAATDTYDLFNPAMESDPDIAGIRREGVPGSYTYTVIGNGKRPVAYVSWLDAARFCNWLHRGRPSGAQDGTTTERGAYTLDGNTTGFPRPTRSLDANFWIPTEDQWYKAAYHDSRGQIQGGPLFDTQYWLYPTQNDDVRPTPEAPPGGRHSANYNHAVGGTTEVGAYWNTPSYYGTFDQGGNVREWTNTNIEGTIWSVRGGGWGSFETGLQSMFRYRFSAETESDNLGFRVASP